MHAESNAVGVALHVHRPQKTLQNAVQIVSKQAALCHVNLCLQGEAGKFMLNGEEIDLGVGPQASMAHRVEALRVLLEQRLGFDVFMK